MNNPTCAQCDCVAGCRDKPELCPNVSVQPVQPASITHADWYAKCNMVEALQDKIFALNAMREAQDEIVVHLREAYAQAIAQPVQPNPDAFDAARYRWLRSVGGRTWTHLEKQAPAVGDNYDNLVDDAMIQQEAK